MELRGSINVLIESFIEMWSHGYHAHHHGWMEGTMSCLKKYLIEMLDYGYHDQDS